MQSPKEISECRKSSDSVRKIPSTYKVRRRDLGVSEVLRQCSQETEYLQGPKQRSRSIGSPQIVLGLHKTRNLHAVESPQKAVYDVRDNTAPWGIALDILIRGR